MSFPPFSLSHLLQFSYNSKIILKAPSLSPEMGLPPDYRIYSCPHPLPLPFPISKILPSSSFPISFLVTFSILGSVPVEIYSYFSYDLGRAYSLFFFFFSFSLQFLLRFTYAYIFLLLNLLRVLLFFLLTFRFLNNI